MSTTRPNPLNPVPLPLSLSQTKSAKMRLPPPLFLLLLALALALALLCEASDDAASASASSPPATRDSSPSPGHSVSHLSVSECAPCGSTLSSAPPAAAAPAPAPSDHCPPPCHSLLQALEPCLPFVAGPPINAAPSSSCCHSFFPALAAAGPRCICHLVHYPFISGFAINTARLVDLFPLCGTKSTPAAILWFQDSCAGDGHASQKNQTMPHVPDFPLIPTPATAPQEGHNTFPIWKIALLASFLLLALLLVLLLRELFTKEKSF